MFADFALNMELRCENARYSNKLPILEMFDRNSIVLRATTVCKRYDMTVTHQTWESPTLFHDFHVCKRSQCRRILQKKLRRKLFERKWKSLQHEWRRMPFSETLHFSSFRFMKAKPTLLWWVLLTLFKPTIYSSKWLWEKSSIRRMFTWLLLIEMLIPMCWRKFLCKSHIWQRDGALMH